MTEFITLRQFKDALAREERPEAAIRKQVATQVKQFDREELTVDFVISTAARDRENDTISVSGWETGHFMNSPVVLWCHDHQAPPVAQALSLTVTDAVLMAKAKFTSREISPFGYMIFQMYAERFLRATSVGFIPFEWDRRMDDDGLGVDFNRQELLEFSCVPVPANPEALALVRSKGIDLVPLRKWAEEVLDTWSERRSDVALPRRKLEELRRDVVEITGPLKLTLSEQVELGQRNLDAITRPRTGRDGPGEGKSGIQSLIFDKEHWSVSEAKEWAGAHNFYKTPVDETEDSIRIRQFDPEHCDEDSFQTLTENFPEGLSVVQCTGKGKSVDEIVLEVDESEVATKEPVRQYEGLDDLMKEVRADLTTFIRVNRKRFDAIEEKLLNTGNALAKLTSRERLDDQVRNLNKAADARAVDLLAFVAKAQEEQLAPIKATLEELSGLRSGIELNVERKLLDFEVSVASKLDAALDAHLTEARTASEAGGTQLLAEVQGQVKRELDASLDRFKDYYSGRLADYEARDEQRTDRVTSRLQDVQQLLLRAVSKLDQAITSDQASEGLQSVNEQLSLFGEAVRELVDVLGKLAEENTKTQEITVEPDETSEEDGTIELDVTDEELEGSLQAAVGSSFQRLVTGEIGRRLDQIRGRLD